MIKIGHINMSIRTSQTHKIHESQRAKQANLFYHKILVFHYFILKQRHSFDKKERAEICYHDTRIFHSQINDLGSHLFHPSYSGEIMLANLKILEECIRIRRENDKI